jgi:hypothetical protein
MAVGQRQRLYSGVRMFTRNYLSSTPRDLRIGGVQLELRPLACVRWGMAVAHGRHKCVIVSLPKRFRRGGTGLRVPKARFWCLEGGGAENLAE